MLVLHDRGARTGLSLFSTVSIENQDVILRLESRFSRGLKIKCQLTFDRYFTRIVSLLIDQKIEFIPPMNTVTYPFWYLFRGPEQSLLWGTDIIFLIYLLCSPTTCSRWWHQLPCIWLLIRNYNVTSNSSQKKITSKFLYFGVIIVRNITLTVIAIALNVWKEYTMYLLHCVHMCFLMSFLLLLFQTLGYAPDFIQAVMKPLIKPIKEKG